MSNEHEKHDYVDKNGYMSSMYYLVKKYNAYVKIESLQNIDKKSVFRHFSKQANILGYTIIVNSKGEEEEEETEETEADGKLYYFYDSDSSGAYRIEIEDGIVLESSSSNFFIFSLLAKNTDDIKKLLLKDFTLKSASKIYMIAASAGDLYLQSLPISKIDNTEDILLNYNKDFEKSHQRIFNSLQESKKGIVLLHGLPGSGKTYYLKYLTNIINKKFIWLPSHMTSVLTDSNFCSFILSNCKNSVLVIEDAEKYLQKRDSASDASQSISNILNITDGMISDALGLQLICTFNCEDSMIDSAILRSGRLIEKYEFKLLDTEVAKSVAGRLNKQMNIVKPTLLADIYNSENIKSNNNEKTFVGFNTK